MRKHMKVLITGGSGYIGSHMCLELLRMGKEVVVIDNLDNSSMEVVKRVEGLSGSHIPFYKADVRSAEVLDKVFAEHSIECVIHFAGLKAVGKSVSDPLGYYSNNLISTMSLCQAMLRNGVNKIIFSSSATVYAGDNPMPLTEESRTGSCTNPYGWTKFMSEQIIRDTAAANPGFSAALLRYFNVIGADSSGRIGDDPEGVPNNLFPYIAQVAVGRREYLPVYGSDYNTPDGTCIRDYIHVTDLVKGHIAAMEYCEQHTGAEAFNLGTGKGTSNLELKDAFAEASGVDIPFTFQDRRPGDLPITYTSTEKSAKLLNWRAEKTVRDACADGWKWQSGNPYGYGKK